MSIICEEIFDDHTHPSEDEIRDYASKIGIDPDSEPHLLPLAAEGLMKALPPGWRPCLDEKSNKYYYHNNLTGQTQWEHPLDDVYRTIVKKVRTESPSVSVAEHTEDGTYARDELLSYEEPPLLFSALPKTLEPLVLGARKKDIKLSPINVKGGGRTPAQHPKLSKQKSEEPSGPSFSKALNIFSSFDESKDSNKPELTLSGGGAMFLKSNTKKLNDASPVSVKNSSSSPDPPRSILRDRSLMEPSKSMEFDKSIEKSEKDDDDKKSVRFNLDNNTDVAFTLSDKSSSEEEFKDNHEVINVKISANTSRFTVSPVQEPFCGEEKKNLKLIKPNPGDFIKPILRVDKNSDSEDDSASKKSENSSSADGKRKHLEEEKAERRMVKSKQQFWEAKNLELEQFKEDLHESHKKEMERVLISEKSEYESKIKAELDDLRKEMENRTNGTLKEERIRLENDFETQKEELKSKYELEKQNFEQELAAKLEEEKRHLEVSYKTKLEKIEKDLEEAIEKRKEEMMYSYNSTLEQLKENHSVIMDDLKRDFNTEEQILRLEHQQHMEEIRRNAASDIENDKHRDDKLYEKIKNEKRLLDDKYRCLKDKYLRLKTEVKMSIAKRHSRKKEQSGTTTTGSETERSHSINKERSPMHSPSSNRRSSDKPPTPKHSRSKPENPVTRQIIIQDLDTSASDHSFRNDKNDNDSSDTDLNPGRSRKKLFSRIKSSSTSRINNAPLPRPNSSNIERPSNFKPRKSQRSCSPVENLRRQLQKLEDLEDQIPQHSQADTYHLRYPFDTQKFEGSSELEFFRHRIHLERDSIKRAKESLRTQKTMFQQRQKELKLKHGSMARHTLQQLCQEEKELTDMEVSLHRTRSLLGEKVIRLRHLEHSLQRATQNNEQMKPEDGATLSDISSHSASSGISSTEFATADNLGKNLMCGERFQESSEIIQSLENLNSEIREIWEVLYKQQQSGNVTAVLPPYPVVYPDLGWPILAGTTAVPAPPSIPTLADRLHNYRQHVALANAQSTVVTHATQGATTTLVERTRNLRHWLRQAGLESVNDGNAPQATL